MGCQVDISKIIVDAGGQYLLAVKDNQPTLHQDIQSTFLEAADDRQRSVCRDLAWLTTAQRWEGLSYVAQVVRERTVLSTGKTSMETSYYIGSDPQATVAGVGRLNP